MTQISNYHTHTTFCDGSSTPDETVREAIYRECPAIGFSGHSYVPFDEDYSMTPEREEGYRKEILRLKNKYKDYIRIFLGLEQDYYSPAPTEAYDYLIGSVHYICKDGEYFPVDADRETLVAAAEKHYGGDMYALIEDYYRLVGDIYEKTHCAIVGHFDLITKFNEDGSLFDESDPRYRKAALNALHRLLDQGALLEINTGAIARGYRTAPYPAPFLLDEMGKCGAKAILSSDAHRDLDILTAFPQAEALAKEHGVTLVDDSPF